MPPRPRIRSMRYWPTRDPGPSSDAGSRNPSLSSCDFSSKRTSSWTSAGSPDARTRVARSSGGVDIARSNNAPTRCHRSSARAQLLVEPRARHRPMPLHRGRGSLQRFGNLRNGQPAKITQLDDLGLLRIARGELLERGIECQHVNATGTGWRVTGNHRFIQRDLLGAAAALLGVARAGALHEDLPHRQRRNGEEVRAVLPRLVFFLAQSQKRFVDQGGGLQRLARPLVAQVVGREPPQLVIYLRHQRGWIV